MSAFPVQSVRCRRKPDQNQGWRSRRSKGLPGSEAIKAIPSFSVTAAAPAGPSDAPQLPWIPIFAASCSQPTLLSSGSQYAEPAHRPQR
jgi:hypothetical protein